MKALIAFKGRQEVKDFYLARIAAHRAADEIIQGVYWENGKGCAVGCTVHSNNHEKYESNLGIPIMLAMLQDRIFEGLPNSAAKNFPGNFLSSIKSGADLSCVGWKFLYWLLTKSNIGEFNHTSVRDAVRQCADVLIPLTKGENADTSAAESAAESAARTAAWSAARSAAWSAAWSAAESAWSAADSARSAADSAESAADSAEFAADSARSARFAAHKKMAKKLLQLLASAPQTKKPRTKK